MVAKSKQKKLISIVMGSQSDWSTMKSAAEFFTELNIPYEKKVVSAHRTPDRLYRYAKEARKKGIKVIIAGAGGAAHLPDQGAYIRGFARRTHTESVRKPSNLGNQQNLTRMASTFESAFNGFVCICV